MRVSLFIALTGLCLAGNLASIDILPLGAVTLVFGSIPALIGLRLLGLWPATLIGAVSGAYLAHYFGQPSCFLVFMLEPLVIGMIAKRSQGSLILPATMYWLTLGFLLTLLGGPFPVSELVWAYTFKRVLNGVFNASLADLLYFALPAKVQRKSALAPRYTLSEIFFVGGCFFWLLLIGIGSAINLLGVVKGIETRAEYQLEAEAEKLEFRLEFLKPRSIPEARKLLLQAKAQGVEFQLEDDSGKVLFQSFKSGDPMAPSLQGTGSFKLKPLKDTVWMLIPNESALRAMGKQPSFQWEGSWYAFRKPLKTKKGLSLVLFVPNAPFSNQAYHVFLWWMGVGTLMALGGIMSSLLVANMLSRPIERLSDLTSKPIEELLADFEPVGPKSLIEEVGRLEENFSTMRGALNGALERLKEQEAQKASKENEDRLKTLLNALPDPIVLKDEQAHWLVANKTATERFSLEGVEWYRKTDEELALVLPFYETALLESRFADSRAIKNKTTIAYETEIMHTDGAQRCYAVNKIPLLDEQGRVRFSVTVWRDVTREKKAKEEIQRLLNYDPATGLPNRVLLLDRLTQALKASSYAAVVHLDIDKFKRVVDVFGFDAGSGLLNAVAQRIKGALRPTDTLAKFPEDAFVLVLSGLRQPDDTQVVAKKVLDTFLQPFHVGEQEVHLTVSIGFAIFPTDGKDAETLLKNAELAMLRAKELGGNTAQRFSSDLGMRMANFLILENKLRAAVKGRELTLFYQPQVAINEQKIIGMEALIRWLPAQGGIVSPGDFIPVAEQSGLIIDIGEWVLKESLSNLRAIKKETGFDHLYVSINLSPRQFIDSNLVHLVERTLAQAGIGPHELELEITESTAMKNLEYALKVLQAFKSMGVRIALDDFGVDYSSLSYVHRFPIDTIKVDRAFIIQMLSNPSSAAVVKAVIQIAQALNLKVIAEGVETEEQLDFLKTQACFGVQGYIFSKPLPFDDFLELLKHGLSDRLTVG
jgi:diguanylate cyclase (GGDEF)-like protein/PAS domain S-box-containing protein